jgi:hypothetical protein
MEEIGFPTVNSGWSLGSAAGMGGRNKPNFKQYSNYPGKIPETSSLRHGACSWAAGVGCNHEETQYDQPDAT